MANALFVCFHNAGRSQMSQALFERAAAGRHGARSAGTTPGDRVHPEVIAVMADLGIDLGARDPRKLTEDDARWADVVVTMGCGDECPYIPGRRYVDWDLPDPKGQPIEAVRATREEIAKRVDVLVARLDAATVDPGSPMVACSLGSAELEARLGAISALGAESLIDHRVEGSGHRLRFRPDPATRARLTEIVAAESRCCSFLRLSLGDEGGALVLSIDAPEGGRETANDLAAAFSPPS